MDNAPNRLRKSYTPPHTLVVQQVQFETNSELGQTQIDNIESIQWKVDHYPKRSTTHTKNYLSFNVISFMLFMNVLSVHITKDGKQNSHSFIFIEVGQLFRMDYEMISIILK